MYIIYGLMCLIFGTTFLTIKVGIAAGAPPYLFAGTRFFCAGIIVLVTLKLFSRDISVKRENITNVCIVGLFMTAVMFGCLYWGEQYVSSSIAALLAATTPIMIGSVEWFQGKLKNSWCKALGLVLSFAGVVIAVLPALGIEATPWAVAAVLLILAAEGGSVFGTIRSKRLFEQGLNPFVLNGWQMVIGGALLILLSLVTESITAKMNYEVFFSWSYLVLFGSLGGHGAYYWLVQRAGALLPSTWTYISPVIAQFVGYYVLVEYLSVYSFIGLAMVLGGVFIVTRAVQIEGWLKKCLLQQAA